MFFIQMSGFPGSGKSTLSREIAKRTGAVLIDHDIVKTALLESMGDAQIDNKSAGRISYNIDWSLIDFHLSQGRDVIFDSPCLYDEIIEKGTDLSRKYMAKYKYIECYLDNMSEINFRLQNRERKISQIERVSSEDAFRRILENSKKPTDHKYLAVDTTPPLQSYMDKVMEYVAE
jgi:adenylate kinase family enzyme